jgi:hypothetical protein
VPPTDRPHGIWAISVQVALPERVRNETEGPGTGSGLAARWLLRYLEECDEPTIDEAAMVAACLAALVGDRPPGRGADASGHGRKSD